VGLLFRRRFWPSAEKNSTNSETKRIKWVSIVDFEQDNRNTDDTDEAGAPEWDKNGFLF